MTTSQHLFFGGSLTHQFIEIENVETKMFYQHEFDVLAGSPIRRIVQEVYQRFYFIDPVTQREIYFYVHSWIPLNEKLTLKLKQLAIMFGLI